MIFPKNWFLVAHCPDLIISCILTSSSISSSTSLMISALNSASRSRMGFLSTLLLLTNGCCTPRSVNQTSKGQSIIHLKEKDSCPSSCCSQTGAKHRGQSISHQLVSQSFIWKKTGYRILVQALAAHKRVLNTEVSQSVNQSVDQSINYLKEKQDKCVLSTLLLLTNGCCTKRSINWSTSQSINH